MNRVFTARYPGRCAAACGDPIEVGDLLRYAEDDAVVHAQCTDRQPSETRIPVVVCSACHLTKPCDCEDPS